MKALSIALAGAILAGTAAAQHSVIFCLDANELSLDNGGGLPEAGLIRDEEFALVTPLPGVPYSASIFLSVDAQNTYLGDGDADGKYVDSSTTALGGDADACFIKRHIGAPVGTVTPHDLYISQESNNDFPAGFEDSDVFRYAGNGVLDVFITEQLVSDAIGGGSSSMELDAICQDASGNLYISFGGTETVGITDESVSDGGLVRIPAADITYDLTTGNVLAVTFDSAVEVADEADMNALIANSLVLTSVGGVPSTSLELSGLEIDPAGGTWTAPFDGAILPNLLFTWGGFSNDGAILSTAGGGQIATINGVAMGSQVATLGDQVGLFPDGTGLGGLMGLAVIDAQLAELACEIYPNRVVTTVSTLWTYPQASGCTPGGTVVFFWDIGPNTVGGVIPRLDLGPLGEWYGMMIPGLTPGILGITTADIEGYAGVSTFFPAGLMATDLPVAVQALDITTFHFSTPGTVDFL